MNREAAGQQEDKAEERESELLPDENTDVESESAKAEHLDPPVVNATDDYPAKRKWTCWWPMRRPRSVCISTSKIHLAFNVWPNWRRADLMGERRLYLSEDQRRSCF
jgi:hypothetical protein